jgi:hypothetical protein
MSIDDELLKSIMQNDPERAEAFLKGKNPYEARGAYNQSLNDFLRQNYEAKNLAPKKIASLFEPRQQPLTTNIKTVNPVQSTPESFIRANKQDIMTRNFGKNVDAAYEPGENISARRIWLRPDTDASSILHEYGHDNDLINKGFEGRPNNYSPDQLKENMYRYSLNNGTNRFLEDLPIEVRTKLLNDKWSGVDNPEKSMAEAATPMGTEEIMQARRAANARASYIEGGIGADNFWEGHHERGLFEKEALSDLVNKGQIGEALVPQLVGNSAVIAAAEIARRNPDLNPLAIQGAGEGSDIVPREENNGYNSIQKMYLDKKYGR